MLRNVIATLLGSSFFLLSAPVYAQQQPKWDVKITSFSRITERYRSAQLAEVCGTVQGPRKEIPSARLRVISDYKAKTPGIYNTQLDPNGKFCHVISTLLGQVEVRLWFPAKTGPATPNTIRFQGKSDRADLAQR